MMVEYRRRRPPLYRLARYLRWSAVLAAVLVVVFLISTAISAVDFASGLHVSTPKSGGYNFNYTEATGFTASFEANITNAGLYPLVLDLTTVANTPQGPLVPRTTTGVVTLTPGGRSTPIGFTIRIPESTLVSTEDNLLVNNTPVSGDVWFNGSYAYIYQFGFSVAANGTWGAPFENLTVVPGTPTSADGQTTIPVSLNYTNNAVFEVSGNLTVQVIDDGSNCGPPATLPVDTPSGHGFLGVVNLTGPSSCMVPGATVSPAFLIGPVSLPLPSVRIP